MTRILALRDQQLRPGAGEGVWARWPAMGELRPQLSLAHLHTISVTMTREVTDLDEVLPTLSDRLALFHLMVSRDERGRTVFVLTLEARDVWLATLNAMGAITSTGYIPVRVSVEPAAEFEQRLSCFEPVDG